MATASKIQWTDHTWNPWRGCTKVSDGCKFCYADTLSKRNPKTLGIWGRNGTRVIASDSAWRDPAKWNEWAARGVCYHCGGRGEFKHDGDLVGCADCQGTGSFGAPYRARVFCASLADVGEGPETMPDGSWLDVQMARVRLSKLIMESESLDFLLLTKRPQNMTKYFDAAVLSRCWVGTSVENQEAADERIPHLLKVPAAVRFLSVEPMLGPVNIQSAINLMPWQIGGGDAELHWVIVGCESGGHAREMKTEWAQSIADQCRAASVAFFMKQLVINGKVSGELDDFPESLRIRQMPQRSK